MHHDDIEIPCCPSCPAALRSRPGGAILAAHREALSAHARENAPAEVESFAQAASAADLDAALVSAVGSWGEETVEALALIVGPFASSRCPAHAADDMETVALLAGLHPIDGRDVSRLLADRVVIRHPGGRLAVSDEWRAAWVAEWLGPDQTTGTRLDSRRAFAALLLAGARLVRAALPPCSSGELLARVRQALDAIASGC